MGRNFKRDNQRCGFYDENNLPHGGPSNHRERRFADELDRYNREDPFEGIQQITTGFRKWAERYLAACSGQKKHKYIVNRMKKWSQKLQDLLSEKPTTVSTTEQQFVALEGIKCDMQYIKHTGQIENCLECCVNWCKQISKEGLYGGTTDCKAISYDTS